MPWRRSSPRGGAGGAFLSSGMDNNSPQTNFPPMLVSPEVLARLNSGVGVGDMRLTAQSKVLAVHSPELAHTRVWTGGRVSCDPEDAAVIEDEAWIAAAQAAIPYWSIGYNHVAIITLSEILPRPIEPKVSEGAQAEVVGEGSASPDVFTGFDILFRNRGYRKGDTVRTPIGLRTIDCVRKSGRGDILLFIEGNWAYTCNCLPVEEKA